MRFEVRPGPRPLPRTIVQADRAGGRFEMPDGGRVEFRGARFREVDFRDLRFHLFIGNASVFTDCNFQKVRIDAGHLGNLGQTVFEGCRFDRANLVGVDPLYARFERCNFDNANLREWRAYGAEFVDCHFAGRIVEAKFGGRLSPSVATRIQPPRIRNEFRGNDFRDATLVACSFFDGIDLSAQVLPAGDEYILLDRISDRILKVRSEIAGWKDDQAREAALLMLLVIEPETRGQDYFFARREDLPKQLGVRDRVWRMLADAHLDARHDAAH